ncbi:MAG TPA: cytochrome c [Rhizomicrobium sp.]
MKPGILLKIALIASGLLQTAFAPAHFANADDDALVDRGGYVYSMECGSCHGRRLQGQPLWQLNDQYAGRRAPAQDATGHTWQHSDEDLFHKTKYGKFPSDPAHSVSYMPAFAGNLDDHDILAVLAYIKSNWPTGLRASQAMLNPGQAGMPKGADKANWTLPPNCRTSLLRWDDGKQ